jgi:amino acid transporter
MLEFVALVVLRLREPELPRPFRVPGGLLGAVAVGIPPLLLLSFAIGRSQHEQVWGMSAFALGAMVIAAGVAVYFVNAALRPQGWGVPPEPKPQIAS